MKHLLLTLLFLPALLLADTSTATSGREKKKLPKSGILSISGSAGYGSYKLPAAWGESENTEGNNAPLAGSVTKVGQKQWKAKVTNQSKEDQYSFGARVLQLSMKGDKVKTDSFSGTLKPKESIERVFTAHANSVSAALELSNWKKKSLAKPTPSGSPPPVGASTTGAVRPGTPPPPYPGTPKTAPLGSDRYRGDSSGHQDDH